jgi:CheY-like chemotaxis protein
MNGIEAAMHIRILQPECRIILFCASHVNDTEEARILQSGFEFLPGPFRPKELVKRLGGAEPVGVIPFRRRIDSALQKLVLVNEEQQEKS